MQAVINNNLVRSLQASDKPIEVRDTNLKGLILRVQPSGTKTYYMEYARGKRVKLGRADAITPTEARERAKEVLSDTYKGNEPEAVKRKKKTYTLRELIDDVYMPWALTHIQRATDTEKRMKHSLAELLDVKITELSSWHVEKWKASRLKLGLKKTSVNRELNDLKACISKAVTWGLLPENPLRETKRFREDSNPIVRFLSHDEEKRLKQALQEREAKIRKGRESGNKWRSERGKELKPEFINQQFVDHLMPMVLLSLNTGLRQGELFSLDWVDINLDQGHLTVHGYNAKSGKTRHIPLNDDAEAVLKHWKQQVDESKGLVFKSQDGGQFNNVRKAWLTLLEDAEITEFRWHDMRHHFASRLVMSGVDLNTVRELLGHSDYKMTLRYAHLAPEAKKAAVQRLVSHGQVIDLPEKTEEAN